MKTTGTKASKYTEQSSVETPFGKISLVEGKEVFLFAGRPLRYARKKDLNQALRWARKQELKSGQDKAGISSLIAQAEVRAQAMHEGREKPRWEMDAETKQMKIWVAKAVARMILAINPEALIVAEKPKNLKHADPRRDEGRMLKLAFPGLRGKALAWVSADILLKEGHNDRHAKHLKMWWKAIREACVLTAQARNFSSGWAEQAAVKMFTDLTETSFPQEAYLELFKEELKRPPSQEEIDEALRFAWSIHWEESEVTNAARAAWNKVASHPGYTKVGIETYHPTDDSQRWLEHHQMVGKLCTAMAWIQRPDQLFQGLRGDGHLYVWTKDLSNSSWWILEHSRIHGVPTALSQKLSGSGYLEGNIQELDQVMGEARGLLFTRSKGGKVVPMAAATHGHPLQERLLSKARAAGTEGFEQRGKIGELELTQHLIPDSQRLEEIGKQLINCAPGYVGRGYEGKVILAEYRSGGEVRLCAEIDVRNFQLVQITGYRDRAVSKDELDLACDLLRASGLAQELGEPGRSTILEWEGERQASLSPIEETAEEEGKDHPEEPQEKWEYQVKAMTAVATRLDKVTRLAAHKYLGRLSSELTSCEVYGLGHIVRMGEGGKLDILIMGSWQGFVRPARHLYQLEASRCPSEPEKRDRKVRPYGEGRTEQMTRNEARELAALQQMPDFSGDTLRVRAYGPAIIGGRLIMQGQTRYHRLEIAGSRDSGGESLRLKVYAKASRGERLSEASNNLKERQQSHHEDVLTGLAEYPETLEQHAEAYGLIERWTMEVVQQVRQHIAAVDLDTFDKEVEEHLKAGSYLPNEINKVLHDFVWVKGQGLCHHERIRDKKGRKANYIPNAVAATTNFAF